MIKFKHLLSEVAPSDEEVETFKNLVGDYSLQGHVSPQRELDLRNVDAETVVPELEMRGRVMPSIPNIRFTPNGFYTSTVYKDLDNFVNKFTTKWADSWAVNPKGSFLHAFTVNQGADVLHVGSKNDVDSVIKSYRPEYEDNTITLSWKEIYDDFDGVHVYGEALNTDQFEQWDIESTVWFRPKSHLNHQFTWKLDFGPVNQLWKDFGEDND